jgi:hypothetical protein
MHIHRTARTRFFTALGNEVLRDNRLSFCARGILAHLLSQSDGQRGDIMTLAERTPEGRERVASAMRELERFGYLRRTKRRTADGHIYTAVDVFDTPVSPSEADVFDTPAGPSEAEVFKAPEGPSSPVEPTAGLPDSGGLTAGAAVDHPEKKQEEEPTLPAPPAEDAESGREGPVSAEAKASAELLARVARAEPRLSLGRCEALRLAPLAAEWRRRGASDLHLICSLTAGLPRTGVHHPARFLESRLRSKMPAERALAPSRSECDECGVPVLAPGLCRTCREIEPVGNRVGADFAQVRARGIAKARAALRGLPFDAAPAAAT